MRYGPAVLNVASGCKRKVPNKYGRRALIPSSSSSVCFIWPLLLFARVMLFPHLAAQTTPGAQHIWMRVLREGLCERARYAYRRGVG